MPKAAPLHKAVKATVDRVHEVQAPPQNYGKGRGGRPWRRLRDKVLARDHYQCQICIKSCRVTEAREVDHIKPKAEGGTDDLGNLQGVCPECHAEKSKAEAGRGRNGSRYRPPA
jgi:5-methylcytosine-specific restriction protein A